MNLRPSVPQTDALTKLRHTRIKSLSLQGYDISCPYDAVLLLLLICAERIYLRILETTSLDTPAPTIKLAAVRRKSCPRKLTPDARTIRSIAFCA